MGLKINSVIVYKVVFYYFLELCKIYKKYYCVLIELVVYM